MYTLRIIEFWGVINYGTYIINFEKHLFSLLMLGSEISKVIFTILRVNRIL